MLCVASEFYSCGAVRVLRISKASREGVGMIRSFVVRPLLGGSASPFIGEGGGLIRERERVCVFPSLIAHVVGYKIVCRRPQYW